MEIKDFKYEFIDSGEVGNKITIPSKYKDDEVIKCWDNVFIHDVKDTIIIESIRELDDMTLSQLEDIGIISDELDDLRKEHYGDLIHIYLSVSFKEDESFTLPLIGYPFGKYLQVLNKEMTSVLYISNKIDKVEDEDRTFWLILDNYLCKVKKVMGDVEKVYVKVNDDCVLNMDPEDYYKTNNCFYGTYSEFEEYSAFMTEAKNALGKLVEGVVERSEVTKLARELEEMDAKRGMLDSKLGIAQLGLMTAISKFM